MTRCDNCGCVLPEGDEGLCEACEFPPWAELADVPQEDDGEDDSPCSLDDYDRATEPIPYEPWRY